MQSWSEVGTWAISSAVTSTCVPVMPGKLGTDVVGPQEHFPLSLCPCGADPGGLWPAEVTLVSILACPLPRTGARLNNVWGSGRTLSLQESLQNPGTAEKVCVLPFC